MQELFLLLWIFLWVPTGLIIGMHARDRGSSLVLWLLTTLCLGIIGLLLYIAVGPDGPPISELSDEQAKAYKEDRKKRRRLLLHGPTDEEIQEWKELKKEEE
jgi:hypothetical protein